MSNAYGFDFLRTEHKDDTILGNDDDDDDDDDELNNNGEEGDDNDDNDDDDGMNDVSQYSIQPIDVKNKPDLEKQFDILAFLQAHPGSGCLAPAIIYKASGIDLDIDLQVAEMLQRNPKVRVERVPDPENPSLTVATYAYQAKYSSVRDRTTLLAQINRMSSGVPMRDLLDSYPGVEDDLRTLITAGDIIATNNSEDKDKVLFPRGESFLVELDGLVTLPKHIIAAIEENDKQKRLYDEMKKRIQQQQEEQQQENGNTKQDDTTAMSMPPPPRKVPIPECFILDTDIDPKKQIRRGEAIQIGGQWFRVSSAVKVGVPLNEQPVRAQAPLSVVLLQDLSKRNDVDGYIRPLSDTQIPLDGQLSNSAVHNVSSARIARERLLKLSHGVRSSSGASSSSGGGAVTAAQLTGSLAHSSNPLTLAASFATSTMNNITNLRKRSNFGSNITKETTGDNNNNMNHNQSTTETLTKESLEKAAADIHLALYSHARRHGCTKDIRELYLQTRSLIPESDSDLQKVLLEHRLLENGEQMRRPRLTKQGSNVDNDGKPKKRRYYERKNQRMTNTHLEGTEIGAILARAAEKQKQGKTVGDGGM